MKISRQGEKNVDLKGRMKDATNRILRYSLADNVTLKFDPAHPKKFVAFKVRF